MSSDLAFSVEHIHLPVVMPASFVPPTTMEFLEVHEHKKIYQSGERLSEVRVMHWLTERGSYMTGPLQSFKAYVLRYRGQPKRQSWILYEVQARSGVQCWLAHSYKNRVRYWNMYQAIPTHPTNRAINYLDDVRCASLIRVMNGTSSVALKLVVDESMAIVTMQQVLPEDF